MTNCFTCLGCTAKPLLSSVGEAHSYSMNMSASLGESLTPPLCRLQSYRGSVSPSLLWKQTNETEKATSQGSWEYLMGQNANEHTTVRYEMLSAKWAYLNDQTLPLVVLLLEKNEQPHDSQMRKDGFRLREGSREMGCDSDCWEGAGMEGRSGLLLSICREGTPRVCVVTPTSLPRGSCFLAPTGWFTGTVGGLEAASASGCPFHFVRKLSPPDLDGLGTQDKRCLWTFNYWGLFSSQGRNIELQVWSSAWQVVHELPC